MTEASLVKDLGTAFEQHLPVAIGDDWVYARSVEILIRQHELRILDLSVVTLVFQVVWGAFFATIFGVDDTIDPADTRPWLANLLRSLQPRPRGEGKRRSAIDAW